MLWAMLGEMLDRWCSLTDREQLWAEIVAEALLANEGVSLMLPVPPGKEADPGLAGFGPRFLERKRKWIDAEFERRAIAARQRRFRGRVHAIATRRRAVIPTLLDAVPPTMSPDTTEYDLERFFERRGLLSR
jgi:hypothetical protein